MTISVVALWLTHRRTGWLAKPLRALGVWLDKNTATLSAEAMAAVAAVIQAEFAKQHPPVSTVTVYPPVYHQAPGPPGSAGTGRPPQTGGS